MRPVKISALLCALVLLLLQSTGSFANTFTLLYTFGGADNAALPIGGVTLWGNTLYGTTYENIGNNGLGVVYSISTNGSNFSVLHNFNGSDGESPMGTPVVDGGWLYGTTRGGGSNLDGLIYCLCTNGSNFTVLHYFDDGLGGKFPQGALLLAGGMLYGTTGYSTITNAYGTIYSINTNGSNFTILHSFTNGEAAQPSDGPLVLSGTTLYGMTVTGGASNVGVIYSICTNGSNFNILHTFMGTDGANPMANLVLCSNTLYGAAGTVFAIDKDGGNFRQFQGYANCALTLSGTTIFGSTVHGGSGGSGTLFSMETNGANYRVVYNFSAATAGPSYYTNADGTYPWGTISLCGSNFFGIAGLGGANGSGTLYELTLQAPPATNNHGAFFSAEVSLGGSWYYLNAPTGNQQAFGYYNMGSFPYVYHLDMGWEYFIDANDASHGAYYYDFADNVFFYTTPGLWPYLYDFKRNVWIYYLPQSGTIDRYSSSPRWFFDLSAKVWLNHL